MYNFKEYLVKLNESSGIDFRLITEEGQMIFNTIHDKDEDSLKIMDLSLSNQGASLYINKKFEICASLLKYSIENKYKEIFSLREQLIVDMLEGKGITSEALYNALPFLSAKCTIFLIYVDKNRYEVLSLMKKYYDSEGIISFVYKNFVVVIGNFEDELDHARSISDIIASDVFVTSYISYENFQGATEELAKAYKEAASYIEIGIKYNLKGKIYTGENLLFEKTIYNVSNEVKEEIYYSFKDKLSRFDNEMINTIDEFLDNGLNISEASKKLYIHRNTLIYRLDKIQKDTGYDIRNFKQATIFTIAFLIWKEKRRVNL